MHNSPQGPTELRVSKDRKQLTIKFSDDESYMLEAELLRVRSPSAEVQGHSPEQRVLVYGKRNVGIMKLHAIGNYAIRVEFDDMHNTGIFTWKFLRQLGETKQSEWDEYEAELKEDGKSRDN